MTRDKRVRHLCCIHTSGRFAPYFFLLTLILALPALAYDFPLSPNVIREAYFFGRSADRGKVSEFLAQYVHRLEPEKAGTGVQLIELRTPYEEVVLRSSENQTVGYSAQQAQIDYAAQPDCVKVRVFLFIGTADPRSSSLYSDGHGRILDHRENFWREFKFRVTQERLIEPKKLAGEPIYSRRGKGLQGAEVKLDFDAGDFAPRETRVEVITPDGRIVVAEFALDQLR